MEFDCLFYRRESAQTDEDLDVVGISKPSGRVKLHGQQQPGRPDFHDHSVPFDHEFPSRLGMIGIRAVHLRIGVEPIRRPARTFRDATHRRQHLIARIHQERVDISGRASSRIVSKDNGRTTDDPDPGRDADASQFVDEPVQRQEELLAIERRHESSDALELGGVEPDPMTSEGGRRRLSHRGSQFRQILDPPATGITTGIPSPCRDRQPVSLQVMFDQRRQQRIEPAVPGRRRRHDTERDPRGPIRPDQIVVQSEYRPIRHPDPTASDETCDLDGNLSHRGRGERKNAQPPTGSLDESRHSRDVGVPRTGLNGCNIRLVISSPIRQGALRQPGHHPGLPNEKSGHRDHHDP